MNLITGFTPKGNAYIFIRTGPLLLLVLVELIILFTFKDGGGTFLKESGQSVSAFLREQGGIEFLLVGYTRIFVRIGFIAYLIASIAVVFTRMKMSASLTSFNSWPHFQIGRLTLVTNALCFLILLGLFFAFQNPVALLANPYSLPSLIYAFSPIIWLLYLFSICDLVFPVKGLLSLVAKDWLLFVVVFAVVLIISYPQIYENLINFWSNLLLIPAIELASVFSWGFGLHYQMLPILNDGIPVFGTHQFSVEIAPACSGYEGMTLITLLLGLYCYLQRGSLRMTRALWIFPIAVVMMFLLNGLRIFILVAIGHYWSPEAALNGFHTVGGWLNLLTVWIASLLALNFIPFFQRHTQSKAPLEIGDKALLIPDRKSFV
jgi:exosortase/archaeosortase family protein